MNERQKMLVTKLKVEKKIMKRRKKGKERRKVGK